jgi:hypothetical protein
LDVVGDISTGVVGEAARFLLQFDPAGGLVEGLWHPLDGDGEGAEDVGDVSGVGVAAAAREGEVVEGADRLCGGLGGGGGR